MRLGAVLAASMILACQAWDQLEPTEREPGTAQGSGGSAGDSAGPGLAAPRESEGTLLNERPRLTGDVAIRRVTEIEAASGQQRLSLIEQFTDDFPEARFIEMLAWLEGEAYMRVGEPSGAAAAYERAVLLSGGADVIGLPHSAELAYRLGWATYQGRNRQRGIELLVMATFISDRPELEQGLAFVHAEDGGDPARFREWLASRRNEHAVEAPDFELPGYRRETSWSRRPRR